MRDVHKPKKGTIIELPLGQQAEFGSPEHAIIYCGMPNQNTYSLGIRGKGVETVFAQGSSFPGYNVFIPVPKEGERQTLDDVLERTAEVEVVKVQPRSITLKYVS